MIVTSMIPMAFPVTILVPPSPPASITPSAIEPTYVGKIPQLDIEFTSFSEQALAARETEISQFMTGIGYNTIADATPTMVKSISGNVNTQSKLSPTSQKGTLDSAFVFPSDFNSIAAQFYGFRPFRIVNRGVDKATGQPVPKTVIKVGLYIKAANTQTVDPVNDPYTKLGDYLGGRGVKTPEMDLSYFQSLSGTQEYSETPNLAPYVNTPVSQQNIITSVPDGLFVFGPKNQRADVQKKIVFPSALGANPRGLVYSFTNKLVEDNQVIASYTDLIGRYWFFNQTYGTQANPLTRPFGNEYFTALEAGKATDYRALGLCNKSFVAQSPAGFYAVELVVSFLVT